jgi:hypothetical protein
MNFARRKKWVAILGATLIGVVAVVLSLRGIAFDVISAPVAAENVPGTYVASYPFATDVIVLNRDGTFDQQVIVPTDPPPAALKGSWRYNPNDGYITFKGYLSVDNGFGRLNSAWRIAGEGASLPVERVMFVRTVMGSGKQYPYVKQ